MNGAPWDPLLCKHPGDAMLIPGQVKPVPGIPPPGFPQSDRFHQLTESASVPPGPAGSGSVPQLHQNPCKHGVKPQIPLGDAVGVEETLRGKPETAAEAETETDRDRRRRTETETDRRQVETMADGGRRSSLQDVLRGRSDGAQRTESNMIRVFISSTFTDMSSERKVLLENAYPEVCSFCSSLGLVFEVVDLSWGIQSFLSGDHEVLEICLQEIQRSRKMSAGPAFVGLLGNRYGHRPLPRLIPEQQFQLLLSKLSRNPDGLQRLQDWFLRDNNSVPPTYVLQPITSRFPHCADLRPEMAKLRDEDLLSWRLVESHLLGFLRSAAAEAEAAGDIAAEQKQLFYSSVIEREFQEGVWSGEPPALLFVRESPRQRMRDGPKCLAKFLDVTVDGLLDAEAQELLSGLKSRLYATSKKDLNLHCVELSRGSVDPKRKEHAQYLDSLCQQFVLQMKTRIGEKVGPGDRKSVV